MILSIDQGTTGTTALVLDSQGEILGRGYSEFRQIFPRPGWVSHSATEIWDTTLKVIGIAIAEAGIDASEVKGIGIANQRETTVLWDRRTGEPLHDAIVWQCRRTADLCAQYRADGLEDMVRKKTGLVIDAYFSASKLRGCSTASMVCGRMRSGVRCVLALWIVFCCTNSRGGLFTQPIIPMHRVR